MRAHRPLRLARDLAGLRSRPLGSRADSLDGAGLLGGITVQLAKRGQGDEPSGAGQHRRHEPICFCCAAVADHRAQLGLTRASRRGASAGPIAASSASPISRRSRAVIITCSPPAPLGGGQPVLERPAGVRVRACRQSDRGRRAGHRLLGLLDAARERLLMARLAEVHERFARSHLVARPEREGYAVVTSARQLVMERRAFSGCPRAVALDPAPSRQRSRIQRQNASCGIASGDDDGGRRLVVVERAIIRASPAIPARRRERAGSATGTASAACSGRAGDGRRTLGRFRQRIDAGGSGFQLALRDLLPG